MIWAKRGFAQARRTDEQHMVERFVAALGRLDEDLEVSARCLLANEIVQCLRAQRLV
jgi:hypothetical protein